MNMKFTNRICTISCKNGIGEIVHIQIAQNNKMKQLYHTQARLVNINTLASLLICLILIEAFASFLAQVWTSLNRSRKYYLAKLRVQHNQESTSVTRCWNKKQPNFPQSCHKSNQSSLKLNRDVFPKSLANIWATRVGYLLISPLKNSQIWSHWSKPI